MQLGQREGRDLADGVGGARGRRAELLSAALLVAATEHEQHRSAEVRGDAGVVAEFGGAGDVGVVAADDHDGVALRLDRLEPGDDGGQCAVGIVAHIVVGDADAGLVIEVHAVVREQQLEHVVGLGGGARDRAEHADPRRHSHQRIEHAQRDG